MTDRDKDAIAVTAAAIDPALDKTHGAAPGATTTDLTIGARLGDRYQIRRFLGEGGMGAVYMALDEVLDKEVALKCVRQDRAGTQGLLRLRDEVLLAQKVTHRGVCRTYDLEQIDGTYLIKMEYVPGQSLQSRLDLGRLSIAQCIDIARDVAAGLRAAHQGGVIHRDLKPHNIQLEEETGRVVLMDFGIARAAQRDPDAPQEGVSGTPEYMAPEQARGLIVDARTDLYALGCVLYRMLTDQVPFPAASRAAAMLRHLDDPPPDPRAVAPAVPAWLAAVVMRLMAKDPAARFQNADEVRTALLGPQRRSNRRVYLALAGLGVAAAALLVVPRLLQRPPWHPVLREMLPVYDENSSGAVLSPDGKQIAFDSDRDGSWRIYLGAAEGGPTHAITPTVDHALFPRYTHDGRSILFQYHHDRIARVSLDGKDRAEIAEGAFAAADCAGRVVIAYRPVPERALGYRLTILELDGHERELKRLPEGEAFLGPIQCDAAGKAVVYATTASEVPSDQLLSDAWILPVDGGAARALTSDHASNQGPTFTPDGTSVVLSAAHAGKLQLWEIPLGAGRPRQLTFGDGSDVSPAISADGRRLIFDVDVTARPLFAAGEHDRRKLTRTIDDVSHPIVTRDGRTLVAEVRRQGKSVLVAYTLPDGDERTIAEGHLPGLATDDKTIYFCVDGPSATQIFALPIAGGERRQVSEVPGRVIALVAGPNALHLSVETAAGPTAFLAPLDGSAAHPEAQAPIALVVPAPIGNAIAVLSPHAAHGYEVRLVNHGQPLDDPKAPTLRADMLSWSADGRTLAYARDGAIYTHVVGAEGEDRLLIHPGDLVPSGIASAPDGKTIYYSEAVGHVRRQIIDNFADRPR